MLGMVAGSRQLCDPIRKIVSTFGMSSSPLDCWLTHRGIATLRVRHQQACQSAMAIAQSIIDHPAVEKVDYPGLASHPQHAIAKKQFGDRYGNMLSIHLAGTTFRADDFIRILSPTIPFCPSLGEAQTTLSHPASTSHRGCTLEQLNQYGITRNTIRVSVGIEETSELVSQFQSGLDQLR
jgi:cystathionine beta-lyase/cystathionine gamma-synthase